MVTEPTCIQQLVLGKSVHQGAKAQSSVFGDWHGNLAGIQTCLICQTI